MGDIVLLDDLTINQIAAGEVIERPANVVKELVENSIDAGATSITVEIENGGISLIRITDNGKGIAPDDMEMAFERHATSKIRSADDLIKVMTMGFRGEALASIAAISKVELISKTRDSEVGCKIVVEGGNVISKEDCGAPNGTTIIVRELFFNTPVRYKFLKKDFTEGGYIEDAVEKIALINPNISFKLMNNKKTVIQTSGNGDISAVIYSVFGKDIAQNIVNVDNEFEGIKVTGVAGKPEIARSNRSNQLFYVNGRSIKDKLLSAAVEEAYKTIIPNGKYGFCVINIKLNPELVDVNVHPAKLEVRFSDESKVFKAVHYAIKNALLGEDISRVEDEDEKIKEVQESLYEEKKTEPQKRGLFDIFKGKQGMETPRVAEPEPEYTIEVDMTRTPTYKNSIMSKLNTNTIETPEEEDTEEEGIEEELGEENGTTNDTTESFGETQEIEAVTGDGKIIPFAGAHGEGEEEKPFEKIVEKGYEPEEKKMAVYEEATKEIQSIYDQDITLKSEIPDYKILGVAFSTYILLELDNEIYILDQHAAHERVLYENVKKNFYKDGGKESQMLLMPDVLELSKKDMHMVKEHFDLFKQAGFDLEEFGENAIKITGVPVICYDMDTKELFMDVLDGFDITNRTNAQELEEKFLSTVACKAAVKGNMELSEREIRGLLDELLVLDNPFTCPHGRPTAIRITKNEIEHKFGRK